MQFASAPIPFTITERNSDHIVWEGSYEINVRDGYQLIIQIAHAKITKFRNNKVEIEVGQSQTHTADLSTLVDPKGRLISLNVKGNTGTMRSGISSTLLHVALKASNVDLSIPCMRVMREDV